MGLGLGPAYVSHVRRGSGQGPHMGSEAGADEPKENPTTWASIWIKLMQPRHCVSLLAE